MNADVGDLLKKLKVQDPVNIGAVVGLIVSMALFAVVVTSLLRTFTDRQNLTLELQAAQTTIERLEELQTASPENLRQRIAEVKEELGGLLAGMPTDEEVAAEIISYYEYAKDTGTQVTRLEKIVPSPEEEEITAYQVQHYLLQASGQFPDLLRLLGRIATGAYRTIIMDEITMGPDGPAFADAVLRVYSSDLTADPGSQSSAGTESGTGERVAPTSEAQGLGNSSEVSELGRMFEQSMLDENWPMAVAAGEVLLRLAPGTTELTPLIYDAHVAWGQDLASQGSAALAREQFLAALAISPGGEEAVRGLGELGFDPAVVPTTAIVSGEPTDERSASPAGQLLHTVREGESLSGLAQRYHTTVSEIMVANRLRTATIIVGQTLIIPGR